MNKTKSSSKSGSGGSKSVSSSPKHHTGLKPGVNSGPASKKSSSSSSQSGSSSGSKNLSQKFLYQKSSSSGSLGQSYNTKQSSPKASSQSQPGKSSSSSSSSSFSKDKPMSASKERSNSPFPSGLANSSKDMLKMLSFASQSQPLEGLMKSFDAAKKFQIPKLSARGKSDDKPAPEDISSGHFAALHQQQHKFNSSSAPTTPIQSQTPSPTSGEISKNSMEFLRESGQIANNNYGQKYFSNTFNSQQNKFLNEQQQQQQQRHQNKNKKLFKSVSTEQLYGDEDIRKKSSKPELTDPSEFQAIFRSQSVELKAVENQQNQPSTVSLHIVKSPLPTSTMTLMQSDTTMMQSLSSQPMMSVGGSGGGSTNIFTDDDLMDEALNLNI